MAASSSRGAIWITLPFLRMSSPLLCMMISSAWSQGTSFKRKVRLPVTESLITMFIGILLLLMKSPITYSASRTAMFWKFSVSFSPGKAGLARLESACWGFPLPA